MNRNARMQCLWAFALVWAGCSFSTQPTSAASCVQGQSVRCDCQGGLQGAQLCQATGTFGACVCGPTNSISTGGHGGTSGAGNGATGGSGTSGGMNSQAGNGHAGASGSSGMSASAGGSGGMPSALCNVAQCPTPPKDIFGNTPKSCCTASNACGQVTLFGCL